jgi:hypothetical protein
MNYHHGSPNTAKPRDYEFVAPGVGRFRRTVSKAEGNRSKEPDVATEFSDDARIPCLWNTEPTRERIPLNGTYGGERLPRLKCQEEAAG